MSRIPIALLLRAAASNQMGKDVPEGIWEREDHDQDGVITWEEFGGPKGDSPEADEQQAPRHASGHHSEL